MSTASEEIQAGKRFAFGRNWTAFLETLDESRIRIAVESLEELLDQSTLEGQFFLDAGSGSGLFSLAARRLGARVRSLDFDQDCIRCAETLREQFDSHPEEWTIQHGSVLDQELISSLGTFDVVYSWGVLHHTGDMWQAIENLLPLVKPDGLIVLALYNHQGWRSRMWRRVKELYCSGTLGRCCVLAVGVPYFALRTVAVSMIRRRNEFAEYRRNRGMSIVHDWIDWLGGLPFETARPDDVIAVLESRKFTLERSRLTKRLGCNEFVFRRTAE